jgi:iron complex outermembrane receptor protein
MNRIQFLLSTTLLGCVVVAHPAFAQNAPAPAAAQPQVLQEVVVTAEHRTSTAQKTAASVSVRSGADMLTQGRYQLSDILEDVPGISGGAASTVNTSQGSGTDNPAAGLTIRGVQSNQGAGGSITTTAAAAAIYVDDVYNGVGGGYDIDRVEVLRGPQGTLYGRSATAGVVAIHTGDPSTTTLSGQGAAEYGNYDLRHVTGEVNVPLIQDKLAVRLSGNEYERDGYYTADGDARSNADFRAKVLWTPTDNFSALLGYAQEYNLTHSGGPTMLEDTPGHFIPYSPTPVVAGKNNFHQYWGNFNLNLGPVAITYVPAYRTWYENALVHLGGGFDADQTIDTPTDWFMTHEVRIHNTDSASQLQWQGGFLYYQNTLSDVDNLYSNDLNAYLFQSASHKTTTAEGGFAEATYALMPDTRLTGGLRYDYTRVLNNEIYSAGGQTASLTGDQRLRAFNNLTYKVRLEHDLTPRNLLYAAIATGFSPGDTTLTTDSNQHPIPQVLQAETLTAYEVGSKNRFFGSRLQVNGDLYFNDYAGYQTAGINTTPTSPGQPTFATIAAPMKAYGGELEVLARPWANGTVSLNASYTDARYGSFGQYAFLFSKSEVPGVAPFQGSVAYDHRLDLGSATLQLHGGVHFFTAHDTAPITQQWAAWGYAPYVHVPSEAIGDLAATLLFGSHTTITAYVRNIADTRYMPDSAGIQSAYDPTQPLPTFPPPAATRYVTAGAPSISDPRTFGVIVSYKY